LPEAGGAQAERRLRWSLAAGYGFSIQLSRGRAEEQLVLVAPAVAYPFSRHFELFVEGHLSGFFTPDGYMLGLVPIGGRYYFSGGKTQPYLALGAGFGWTNLEELDELDRRFNYILQASVGVRWNRPDESAWTLEARISHISNAATVLPNLGLNSIVFLGGWRFR
jgi:Lipid A 3-O-deacylase (PagL)